MAPDKGKIIVNNEVFYDSDKKINKPPQERNLGYLFQNYALFPHLTVKQNIEYGINHLSNEEKEKKIVITSYSIHYTKLYDCRFNSIIPFNIFTR